MLGKCISNYFLQKVTHLSYKIAPTTMPLDMFDTYFLHTDSEYQMMEDRYLWMIFTCECQICSNLHKEEHLAWDYTLHSSICDLAKMMSQYTSPTCVYPDNAKLGHPWWQGQHDWLMFVFIRFVLAQNIKLCARNKIMSGLSWMMTFWSPVRWFIKDFHVRCSHEWKLLVKHLTIFTPDCIIHENHWRITSHMTKKIVIHDTPCIILYTNFWSFCSARRAFQKCLRALKSNSS